MFAPIELSIKAKLGEIIVSLGSLIGAEGLRTLKCPLNSIMRIQENPRIAESNQNTLQDTEGGEDEWPH